MNDAPVRNGPPVRGAGLALFFALCVGLAACGEAPNAVKPLEIGKDTVCVLDGMTLADFPGPKAQIHYEPGGPEFTCDTKEMFSLLLRPEQKRRIVAAYTQDMAKADWMNPQGYWIDAKSAFYVVGSKLQGSMGPTVASFAQQSDAQAFAAKHGGKVLRFSEVTLDMVDLSGGVVHDKKM
jgi:copper chaperone NosL